MTEHVKPGCINPAVVLSVENGLIATFTDLRSDGDKPVPAVRISQEKLKFVAMQNCTTVKKQRL